MRRSEVIKGGHKKENRIIVVKEDRLKVRGNKIQLEVENKCPGVREEKILAKSGEGNFIFFQKSGFGEGFCRHSPKTPSIADMS
jgi:hypothetical protein